MLPSSSLFFKVASYPSREPMELELKSHFFPVTDKRIAMDELLKQRCHFFVVPHVNDETHLVSIPDIQLLAHEDGRQLRVPANELLEHHSQPGQRDEERPERSKECVQQKPLRRRLVTDIKEVEVVHQAWMIAANQLRLVSKSGSSTLPQLHVVPLTTILKDVHYLMLGLESESFALNPLTQQLQITHGLCTDDLSPEVVRSVCSRFVATGNTYRQLESFIIASSMPNQQSNGLVVKAFLQAILGFLTGYQTAVLHVFTRPIVSLSTLDRSVHKLHAQFQWLKRVILDSQVPKNHCDLIMHLLSCSFSLHEPYLVSLALYMLNTALQPLFKCIEDWICSGIWHEELQHLGIHIGPQFLNLRQRMLWTHAFIIDKALHTVPHTAKEKTLQDEHNIFEKVLQDIFVCGKSMHLLKVCSGNKHLMGRVNLKKKMHFKLISSPTQIEDVQKECEEYRILVEGLLSLECVTAAEKRAEEGRIEKQRIKNVQLKHKMTLDRMRAMRIETLRAEVEKRRLLREDLKQQMEAEVKRKKEAKSKERSEDELYIKMHFDDQRRELELKKELLDLYSSLGGIEEVKEENFRIASQALKDYNGNTDGSTVHLSSRDNETVSVDHSQIKRVEKEIILKDDGVRNEQFTETLKDESLNVSLEANSAPTSATNSKAKSRSKTKGERPKSLIVETNSSRDSATCNPDEMRTVVSRKQKRSRPIEETIYQRPTSMPILDDQDETQEPKNRPRISIRFKEAKSEKLTCYDTSFDLDKKANSAIFQKTGGKRDEKDKVMEVREVDALVSFESLLETSLILPLRTQLSLVNKSLLNYLMVECAMEDHFKALKNYVLLGDGLYCRQLCSSLFSAMDECNTEANQVVNPATLNRIVDAAVQGSPAASSDSLAQNVGFTLVGDPEGSQEYDILSEVNSESEEVSLKTTSSKIQSSKIPSIDRLETVDKAILNCIRLGYRTDWPINIVVTPEAVESYGRVSQLLLKLKRATWSLEQCFYRIKRMDWTGARSLHAMRHEICHTLCSVTVFIGSQILDVAFNHFSTTIKDQVHSLDDLYEAHQHYLHDLITKCLLNAKSSAVQAALQDLIGSAVKFDLELKSWATTGEEYEITSTQIQRAEAVFNQFRQQAAFLFRVVKKLSARGFHSHLLDLMAAMNFNGFYDDK